MNSSLTWSRDHRYARGENRAPCMRDVPLSLPDRIFLPAEEFNVLINETNAAQYFCHRPTTGIRPCCGAKCAAWSWFTSARIPEPAGSCSLLPPPTTADVEAFIARRPKAGRPSLTVITPPEDDGTL